MPVRAVLRKSYRFVEIRLKFHSHVLSKADTVGVPTPAQAGPRAPSMVRCPDPEAVGNTSAIWVFSGVPVSQSVRLGSPSGGHVHDEDGRFRK